MIAKNRGIADLNLFVPILIVGIIIALACSGQLWSQKKSIYDSKSVRINKSLPTVFLALESEESLKKQQEKPEEGLKWFRLRNNSIWSLKLDASGDSGVFNAGNDKGLSDATLYYELLDKQGNVKESHLCHVCSIISIRSGKSILFSIPSNKLASANSFRIAFSYQWEDMVEVAPEIEPTHYVYFYSRHLGETKL